MVFAQPPVPPGFRSADSKKAVQRAAWTGAALVGVLQLVVPVVLIGWAFVHAFIGVFATPSPDVEAPAVWDGHVWYSSPPPAVEEGAPPPPDGQRQLLRVPLATDAPPEAVARYEGGYDAPSLLVADGTLALLGGDFSGHLKEGVVVSTPIGDDWPSSGWPVAWAGDLAVVDLKHDSSSEGYVLSLRIRDGGRWVAQWSEPVAEDRVRAYELRAVVIDDEVHVFAPRSDDDDDDEPGEIMHAVRGAEGLSPWRSTGVRAFDWAVAAMGSEPLLVALHPTDFATVVVGHRHDGGWSELFRESLDEAYDVGASSVPDADGGGVVVVLEGMLDSVVVLKVGADGSVVRHEHGSSSVLDEAIGMIVLSQIAPFALSVLLALGVSVRMRAHRIGEYAVAGVSVRYASVIRRGIARGIDTLIAVSVPAAILAPRLTDAALDETWVTLVCIGWALPVGLAFTAMEGIWGWTPGKRVVGVRVVGLDLRPVGFGTALVRSVLALADGMFSFAVGIVVVSTSEHWQRIGDQAANTIVIETPRA